MLCVRVSLDSCLWYISGITSMLSIVCVNEQHDCTKYVWSQTRFDGTLLLHVPQLPYWHSTSSVLAISHHTRALWTWFVACLKHWICLCAYHAYSMLEKVNWINLLYVWYVSVISVYNFVKLEIFSFNSKRNFPKIFQMLPIATRYHPPRYACKSVY